jgi:hypothetical protein
LLTDRGTMVVHDCLPPTPELAVPNFITGGWCGVTYQADLAALDLAAQFLAEHSSIIVFKVATLPQEPLSPLMHKTRADDPRRISHPRSAYLAVLLRPSASALSASDACIENGFLNP